MKNKFVMGKIMLTDKVNDVSAVTAGDLRNVSPESYKMLLNVVSDAVQDAGSDLRNGGRSLPIEMFLDLPDNSRLRLWYNPKTKQTDIQFGVRF